MELSSSKINKSSQLYQKKAFLVFQEIELFWKWNFFSYISGRNFPSLKNKNPP